MTEAHRKAVARNGFKGNVVVSTRAALRAQRLVLLMEQTGIDKVAARRRLGIPERTANRYIERWGR